jgi:hypothetical protein
MRSWMRLRRATMRASLRFEGAWGWRRCAAGGGAGARGHRGAGLTAEARPAGRTARWPPAWPRPWLLLLFYVPLRAGCGCRGRCVGCDKNCCTACHGEKLRPPVTAPAGWLRAGVDERLTNPASVCRLAGGGGGRRAPRFCLSLAPFCLSPRPFEPLPRAAAFNISPRFSPFEVQRSKKDRDRQAVLCCRRCAPSLLAGPRCPPSTETPSRQQTSRDAKH